jgi:aminotransferase EvaB
MYRVPFVNPRRHYQELKTEIDQAITNTLSTGDLVLRQQLTDFEQRLAEYVGTTYAVGVASGYHALHLSLLACGIGPGDEVITVAHTFVATVSAIVHCGATPVLIDVGVDHNLDPSKLEAAVTSRTRAVLPVHLNGRVCDMDAVMVVADRHNLLVIEDAAQALGATFKNRKGGAFGKAGCFSFYPFKMLGALGDGGAVTTDDPKLAETLRLLRYNGEDRTTGEYKYHGYSALLDNVQAAVLDVKLNHLPAWISHRRAIAHAYGERLRFVRGLDLPPIDGCGRADTFQNFVVRTQRRDALRAFLRESGIETLVHWPIPMWKHPGLSLAACTLPETESLCAEVLSLPMSAETTFEDVEITSEAIKQFFDK